MNKKSFHPTIWNLRSYSFSLADVLESQHSSPNMVQNLFFAVFCCLSTSTVTARSILTKHERESASSTSWRGSASMTKGGSVCHPELCPRAWLTARQPGPGKGGGGVVRWGEVGESSQCGRLYLRKYQTSSAMMSSSRDRTSTMGRMWLLWDGTSSEEEGEAEPGVREHRQQRSRKERGKANDICAYVCVCKMLGYQIVDTATHLPCYPLATGLI